MVPKKNSPVERRRALAEQLAKRNLDLTIISNPKHIFYLTGFATNLSPWLTLMKGPKTTSLLAVDSDAKSFMLLGRGELTNPILDDSAEPSVAGFDGVVSLYQDYRLTERMVSYPDFIAQQVKEWLEDLKSERRTGFHKVGVEEWHLPSLYRDEISGLADAGSITGISDLIMEPRKTKGRDEISKIRRATEMIEFAYKVAKENIQAGKTELEVYGEINSASFKRYGAFSWIIETTSREKGLSPSKERQRKEPSDEGTQ